ncbi:MAG: endonuclease III [Spirochaetes bacterium]|nr:endonuclease III [Spirochaetota bacterium]
MTKLRAKKIFGILREYYGKINSQLSYSNLYELTIAVVLSAQTTDKQVNSVTPSLFRNFPDFKKLSEAEIREVESIIKSVGLYKTKAKNIINLSKMIVAGYNNILPNKIEELLKLPGIGRKSANVILSMGFSIPAFPVDTHILRIANRIGYIKSAEPDKVEKILTEYIPEESWIESHLLFIKHGRVLCTARKPLCSKCPVNQLCDFVNILSNIS